ncbi:MAG: hypothetical protein EAZ32_00045 [Cytophagia bacterium]|nr:MAG: hypothetical protein EAZ38_02510 [Cytophagales bacterium]TAG43251.1 MAG: hypothetical protein EAZ32_00045 [Cytophagia bacterium]TAG58023.1 MAG: hypothetical protein EAZ29_01465 [Runella slithyformis]TAG76583.1 MAG: hypothetical protein EAZ22_17740 [Cytophagales bacterium]
MRIEKKQHELYQEFRLFLSLKPEEREQWQETIVKQASKRDDKEKNDMREAIRLNLEDVRQRLSEINGRLEQQSLSNATTKSNP